MHGTNRLKGGTAAAAMIISGIVAAPALAGTSATLVQNSSYFATYGGNGPPTQSGSPADSNINLANTDGLYSGSNLTGLSQFDADSILFKNGVVVAGRGSNATMTTGVAITFTNTNSTTVVHPYVTSTILAAGLGLFVTDDLHSTYNGPLPIGTCSTATLLNCSATNHDSYRGPNYWKNSSASFDFNVKVGAISVYDLKGSVGTDANGDFYENLGQAAMLTNFTKVTTPGSPFALGYSWGDTNVKIALPFALAKGESVTAIYTVTSAVKIGDTNYGISFNSGLSTSQIAYASFGDPTGGKNPISPSVCAAGTQCLNPSSEGRLNFPGANLVTDPTSGISSLVINNAPVLNPATGELELVADLTGGIGAPLVTPPPPPPVGGVPEPASWAMLIAGFGLTGATMRRRRAAFA